MARPSDEYAERLIAVFNELLHVLPAGVASVESRRTKKDDGIVVWLKPSNSRAAEFSAHFEDGNPSLVDVSFGWGTTLELPWEANLPHDASFDIVLETVKVLGLAVIGGRSEERFGFLSVRGTIRVDASRVYRSTRFFYPHPFPKTVQYESYTRRP